MNINYNEKKIQSLNESQQNVDISPTEFAQLNSTENDKIKKYQELFKDESNFFNFSNGKKMANFNAKVDVDSKFSLRWHADHSTDLENFFESIENFIKSTLSESDKAKLTKMYSKLYLE